jgi:hypothetical protein
MEKELEMIRAAADTAGSPLFGYREDYTQYKPRGHYARTEKFQRYFRAMQWYGRMGFRLTGPHADRQTLQALLIVDALKKEKVKGEGALAVWKRILKTTAFFAGQPDDLTPEDYVSALESGKASLQQLLASEAGRDALRKRLLRLRKARILSAEALAQAAGGADWRETTAGMRLFGSRYALDSEIFQRLTFDQVTHYQGGKPHPFTLVNARGALIRGFPRGLDLLSAFGSARAEELIRAGRDDRYAGYAEEMGKLRKEIRALKGDAWDSCLYAYWMRAIRALASPLEPGKGPEVLRSRAWDLKRTATALGSWTELRHDTILYTKQSYAARQCAMAGLAKGGRPKPTPPPPPKGYVEPRPEVYRILRAAFLKLKGSYTELGFPKDRALAGNLSRFAATLDTLARIADKELAGRGLTRKEFAFIEHIGARLHVPRHGFGHHVDVSERFMAEMDDVMPVVADVHTNLDARMVLEEAVGWPMTLYLRVPVDGQPTVCVGAVYSYYEFKWPMRDRLTDEAWRKMLKERKAPAMPGWTARYVVTAGR